VTDGSSLRTYDRIADRIRLDRQSDRSPALVVEGKSDRTFVRRVLGEDVRVYLGTTRSVVLDTAADVERLGLERVACVVDRDFDDEVRELEDAIGCLVPYDGSDLESMLWSSPTLDVLLEEVASHGKLASFGGSEALRSAATRVLEPLQRLRRASAVRGWGLNFDARLALARKISTRDLSVRVETLCDSLWHPELGVPKADLYAAAREFPLEPCPRSGLPLLRGRDALAVAGAALRRLLSSFTSAQSDVDRLEEMLRLAATPSTVSDTVWRNSIRSVLGL
jgi:hypothetical protein